MAPASLALLEMSLLYPESTALPAWRNCLLPNLASLLGPPGHLLQAGTFLDFPVSVSLLSPSFVRLCLTPSFLSFHMEILLKAEN